MYKAGKIIGKGGFGLVREGVDKFGMPVAMKYITKKSIKSWININSLWVPQEVAILFQLQKVDGVIGIMDHWEEENEYVIVMERPSLSQDLFSYLNERGSISERETKMIFHQIVNTLVRIHEKGICHRDLKPTNILLDLTSGRPKAKIIDFGCASRFDPLKIDDSYKNFRGTMKYAPPEWLSSKIIFSRASDVWGLGVLLFQMVFGNVSHEWLTNSPLHFPRYLPPEMKQFLYRLLEKKPAKRICLNDIYKTKWMQRKLGNCNDL